MTNRLQWECSGLLDFELHDPLIHNGEEVIDLDRASRKGASQQLRRMEEDGIVVRTVYPQIPPKVEYSLTECGQALCPAFDAILTWANQRPSSSGEVLELGIDR